MPLERCTLDGQPGWRWGSSGVCYPGPGGRGRAVRQGLAMGDLPNEERKRPMATLHDGPDMKLSAMANQYRLAHPEARLSFREALDVVRATPEGLALMRTYNANARSTRYFGNSANDQRAYAQAVADAVDPAATRREAVAAEIDTKARTLCEAHPKLSYREAVKRVFAADPALRKDYATAWRT
jgi:hypothetical protein